jgi:hypothetical protein
MHSREVVHDEQSTVQNPEANSEPWDVDVQAMGPATAAITTVTTRDALFTVFFMPPPGFAGLEIRVPSDMMAEGGP